MVSDSEPSEAVAPVALSNDDVERVIAFRPQFTSADGGADAERVRSRLRQHVHELLADWPLRPMHHTLGISGYEVQFGHPDQLFGTLSICCPLLEAGEREAVQRFLDARLTELPPYALVGFDPAQGQPREAYRVPEPLRSDHPATADSAWGVYAFWAYCFYADRSPQLTQHWPRLVARMEPLLADAPDFDVHRTDYGRDEAQRLNGDVAGLLGFVRLVRIMQDAESARARCAACTKGCSCARTWNGSTRASSSPRGRQVMHCTTSNSPAIAT